MIEQLIIRSQDKPSLYISNILPNAYLTNFIQWDQRKNAKKFYNYRDAVNVQKYLAKRNIQTILINDKESRI